MVISIQDSVLNRGEKRRSGSASLRECVLDDAWDGLGLQEVAQRGVSARVTVVGLHEFESRSKEAAASREGLVFSGEAEEASSDDLATSVAELSGAWTLSVDEFILTPRQHVASGVYVRKQEILGKMQRESHLSICRWL